MPKAQKHIAQRKSPLVSSRKMITTLDQAARAYGGKHAMAKAFNLTASDLRMWKVRGIPTRYELGLYHGVIARGMEPTPKLFGVKSWALRGGVA
jgi:hypothetical protein